MIQFHSDLLALMHWTRRFPRARALSCGLLSSVFLILSFPFFDSDGLWFLAILIPLPLMIVADEPAMRPSRAAIFAGLGTLPAWAWTHHWMWGVSTMGTPILLLYLAFYPALFVWVGHRIRSRFGHAWITLPIVWIGIEFLRADAAFTGYPWYITAQPLIDSPNQILAAPSIFMGVGGMYFVGLLAAILSWQLWTLATRGGKFTTRVAGTLALLVGWIGLGYAGLILARDGSESGPITIGIVQPNVPQDNRMDWTDRQRYADWLTLESLTIASASDPLTPDLIVWPEGFVPGWTFDPISLEHEREYGFLWNLRPKYPEDAPGLAGVPDRVPATTIVDQFLEMQRRLDIPMVVGSVAYENLKIVREDDDWVEYTNDGMFNSAFSVAKGETSPVWYNKMHLTPFGEVMPIISRWESLEKMLLSLGAQGMEFSLSAGDTPTVLTVPMPSTSVPIRVGTPICFEATVPGVCRSLVFGDGVRRADLLVNITNDGWFGDWDPSRRAHMLIARWRCLELATPMIRSANSGVSCVIDRTGGIVEDELTRVSPQDPIVGYLNASVGLGSRGPVPLSGILGVFWGWGLLGLSGLGLFLTFVQKRSEPTAVVDE